MQGLEPSPKAIVRMFHVSKRYGAQVVLNDVSMDIDANRFVVVSGSSGAGKSTLLRLLDMEEQASDGQIIVNGMNLSRMGRGRMNQFRRELGIVFQDYRLIPTRTVFDNVALPLIIRGDPHETVSKKTRRMLQSVGLAHRASLYPSALSGGEQQRAAVARAMITDPVLILADEPTAGLDAESAGKVMDLLSLAYHRGATVILATHDAHRAGCLPEVLVQLSDGKASLRCLQSGPQQAGSRHFGTAESIPPEEFTDR